MMPLQGVIKTLKIMLIFPEIDPYIIRFGELGITWYSLSYVSGILLGWYYAIKITSWYDLGISKKNLDDFIVWVIIGVIIGGRLGYVFFYDPIKYFHNPIEILQTYKGGMSFHGGVIGFLISTYLFTRKYAIDFFKLTDVCAVVVPIGIMLGRCANFINGELYGKITSVPWGMVFPYSDGYVRHPSQIYEALTEGLLLLLVLSYFAIQKNYIKLKGIISSLFLILYAIFRFIIEFFREPDINIGYIFDTITLGQILCIIMFIIGVTLFFIFKKHNAN